ncbi:MAG: DNA repair protein RecO [Parahaliea sp.]
MRVDLQPAYLLHARPYRDSSQLLEVFTAAHGRLSLVARGIHRRARGGSLRVNLQSFRPLLLSFAGRGELQTLFSAEAATPPLPLAGERLFSGLYLNELLLRLLHRHDPHRALFAAYGDALAELAQAPASEPVLRAFELNLLGELGYGVDLSREAARHEPVREGCWYRYSEGHGLLECLPGTEAPGARFSGEELLAIARGELGGSAAVAAKRLLRQVIAEHLGGRPLHTRELFRQYRHRGAPEGEGVAR